MKRMLQTKNLTVVVAVLGVLAMVLRNRLYVYGTDVFNLLVEGHPLEWGLWLVTCLAAVPVLAAVRRTASDSAVVHPASFAAALGHILMAAGIALTVLPWTPRSDGLIGSLWRYLGILSAPLLVYAGFARALGKKPGFLVYVTACLFFVFHLVCHYQSWCSNPQLQDFVFAFAATVCLMLFAYHQAALAAGMGNIRRLTAAGLLSLYLCLVAMTDVQYLYLYLGGAVWAGTGLVSLVTVPADGEKAGDGDASS